MKPSFPPDMLGLKFDHIFKSFLLAADASCFDVVPSSVLKAHRSEWYKSELWRLSVSDGSGDTLAASDDELTTASGERFRRIVFCFECLNATL